MKNIILILLLSATQVFSLEESAVQVIRISDSNNEQVTGAKVNLVGSAHVYYTNIKGECVIPTSFLRQCQAITIESISYKSLTINTKELSSKIILEFR